jgi:hypothetical protein
MARAQRDERTATVDDRAPGREHGHDWWRRQNANADMRRDSPPHHRDVSPQRISTQVGDVLILQTNKSFTIYAVGLVTKEGQQDFCGQTNVTHAPDRAAAGLEGPSSRPAETARNSATIPRLTATGRNLPTEIHFAVSGPFPRAYYPEIRSNVTRRDDRSAGARPGAPGNGRDRPHPVVRDVLAQSADRQGPGDSVPGGNAPRTR